MNAERESSKRRLEGGCDDKVLLRFGHLKNDRSMSADRSRSELSVEVMLRHTLGRSRLVELVRGALTPVEADHDAMDSADGLWCSQ